MKIRLINLLRTKACQIVYQFVTALFNWETVNQVHFRLRGLPWCTISLNCQITLNICNTTKELRVLLRKAFSYRSFRFKLDPYVLGDYAHRLLMFEFELLVLPLNQFEIFDHENVMPQRPNSVCFKKLHKQKLCFHTERLKMFYQRQQPATDPL